MTRKIQKISNSKDHPLWSIYVRKIIRKDGLLNTLYNNPPDQETSTTAVINKLWKEDENERPHIALNLGEEPATLVKFLLLDNGTMTVVWDKNSTVFNKKHSIQVEYSQKLQEIEFEDWNDLKDHLIKMEEIFFKHA